MRPLIVGCGYLGKPVVRNLLQQGEMPLVVTRSVEKARRLHGEGIRAIVADVASDAPIKLPHVDGLIVMLGDDRTRRPTPVGWRRTVLQRLRRVLGGTLRRIVYVSTTGVYGDPSGVIDETTDPAPRRAAAAAHWTAESWLMESDWNPVATRLRTGGIYGPGRLPESASIRHGVRLRRDPHHRLHLIHVEDAARIVAAEWKGTPRHTCLNVIDARPVTRKAFYEEIARLAGWPPPRFAPPAEALDRRGGGAERTIRSRWFDTAIAPHLQFGDYRSGLRHAMQACGIDG